MSEFRNHNGGNSKETVSKQNCHNQSYSISDVDLRRKKDHIIEPKIKFSSIHDNNNTI